ncbi:MAG: SDR family oxidoreductase [Candidatus Omnitrophica bacterium]|nr:SDR family oxidoreductase [Candidatus Omnitrophota bacterium]
MKTIVVTGGAGFIGSHLCERFLGEDNKVICVDNFITGAENNISHLLKDKRFILIRSDVSRYIDIPGPVDAVLHFASPASPFDYHKYPIQTLKVGALGTHNVLGLAKDKGSRFLLASSSEVYGDPLKHPQPESYWGNVNPVGPRGVYDEAKRFGEAMALAYNRTHNVDTKIVRIFNTFGPRMRERDGRAIPEFISQALAGEDIPVFGSGKQTRSFCFVEDEVDGIFRLLGSDFIGPMNIGNPHEMSIMDLAKLIIKLSGSNSKIIHKELPVDDPKVRQPDITLAKKILKWEPRVSVEEGLRRTIEWWKTRPHAR